MVIPLFFSYYRLIFLSAYINVYLSIYSFKPYQTVGCIQMIRDFYVPAGKHKRKISDTLSCCDWDEIDRSSHLGN